MLKPVGSAPEEDVLCNFDLKARRWQATLIKM